MNTSIIFIKFASKIKDIHRNSVKKAVEDRKNGRNSNQLSIILLDYYCPFWGSSFSAVFKMTGFVIHYILLLMKIYI
jgi:hypothetical protein